MKIVVSSTGSGLDSKVDEKFGRAPFFLVVDADTLEFEAVDNASNLSASYGAGVGSAQIILDSGAVAVISGHIGPKAFSVLNSAGIKAYSGAGFTCREAVQKAANGELEPMQGAGGRGRRR